MLFDLHLTKSERPFRRSLGALRYYVDEIRSIIPNLGPSPEEAKKAEDEARQKQNEAARRQPQQPQQQQQTTQPKTQRMDQSVREDRAAADRRDGGAQQHAESKALKDASGQGVQELRHSEFVETTPRQVHTGSAFRAPSSAGGNVLQNARVLSGEAHPERAGGSPQEGMTGFLRGEQNRPQAGMRLGDLARFAGVQEGGHLPPGAWANPAAGRWTGNRAGLPASQPFSPESPFARLADQAFGRTWSASSLNSLLNQAAQNLADAHPALMDRSFPAAAVLHGGLLFVRDGDRFRAFRLLDDGTLYEASQEHQGTPLSSEARAEMARVLKQKGIHARLSGEKEALVDEKQLEGKMAHLRAKDHSLAARGEFRTLYRDDSSFSHLLREVLEEGKDIGEYLAEGEDAQFAEKGDWPGFFSRMLGLGSSEKPTSKTFDEIMSFIFRGLFKKKGEAGGTLVSDIKYKNPGLLKEDKFAQIGIANEELFTTLKNLRPGQPIAKDLLQRFMGEELSFLQLIHVLQRADPALASEILRNVRFDPMANVDPYSQARVEHHIFSRSRKRAQEQAAAQAGAGNPAVFGNVYELQDKQKREVMGKPKLYTFITYGVILIAILLTLYFLVGN